MRAPADETRFPECHHASLSLTTVLWIPPGGGEGDSLEPPPARAAGQRRRHGGPPHSLLEHLQRRRAHRHRHRQPGGGETGRSDVLDVSRVSMPARLRELASGTPPVWPKQMRSRSRFRFLYLGNTYPCGILFFASGVPPLLQQQRHPVPVAGCCVNRPMGPFCCCALLQHGVAAIGSNRECHRGMAHRNLIHLIFVWDHTCFGGHASR